MRIIFLNMNTYIKLYLTEKSNQKLTRVTNLYPATCTCIISLYIEFHEFNGNIIIAWSEVSTQPQFNVISSSSGQLLQEPRRIVELTAGTGRCTVLTIPEYIVGIEHILIAPGSV